MLRVWCLAVSAEQSLLEAYTFMRRGVLYFVSSIAMECIGLPVLAVLFVDAIVKWAPHADKPFPAITNLVIASTCFFALLFAVYFIGIWRWFVPGVRRLAEIDKDFSSASTLINIGWFWSCIVELLLLPIQIAIVFSSLTSLERFLSSLVLDLLLLIAPGILQFLGWIGFIVLNIKLYSKEKIDGYLDAVILDVIRVVLAVILAGIAAATHIPMLGVYILNSLIDIGKWILILSALKSSIERVGASLAQQPKNLIA